MKKVNIKNKSFKVIPEAKRVEGSMPLKWVKKDMKRGIKPMYKTLIEACVYGVNKISEIQYIFGMNSNKISATAYCDDNDKFDENVGIQVCSAKLEYKNHMKMAKAYDKTYKVLQEISNIVYDLCKEHVRKANAIEDDMVRTYGRRP